jgi:hypothetical protein
MDEPATLDEPTKRLMKFFQYAHLPEGELQDTSRQYCELAEWTALYVKPGAERTVALRKLLEAKDAAVRAQLP